MPSENLTESNQFKEQDNEKRPNNWKEKVMHGQYFRQIEDKDKINIWKWMGKNNLKGCTEALICSTQEQALRKNYVKFCIEKTTEPHLSRICGVANE